MHAQLKQQHASRPRLRSIDFFHTIWIICSATQFLIRPTFKIRRRNKFLLIQEQELN